MPKSTTIVFLAAAGILAGCRATPPGKWETATITKIKHSITVGGKQTKNPLPATPENIEGGRIAFSHYCVACHGFDGQNTGVPFAETVASSGSLVEFSLSAIVYRWATSLDSRERDFSFRHAGITRNPDGKRVVVHRSLYSSLASGWQPRGTADVFRRRRRSSRFRNRLVRNGSSANKHNFCKWNRWVYPGFDGTGVAFAPLITASSVVPCRFPIGAWKKHGRTVPSASITAETHGALHTGDSLDSKPNWLRK